MDRSAIEAIAELVTQNHDASCFIINEKQKIVSNEFLDEQPRRFRASFATHLIDDFVAYCEKYGTKNSAFYIDDTELRACCILDYGAPEQPLWGEHRASIFLRRTPEFEELLKLNNKSLSQQELIDFANDNNKIIGFEIDDSLIDFNKAINCIRKLNLQKSNKTESTIGNFSSSKSALENIDLYGDNNMLPSIFLFDCCPYENTEERTFIAELRANVHNEKDIKLSYRIRALNQHNNEIAEEFKQKLTDAFNGRFNFYIGSALLNQPTK